MPYKIKFMHNPLEVTEEDRNIEIEDESIIELFFRGDDEIVVRRVFEEGESVSTYVRKSERFYWKEGK